MVNVMRFHTTSRAFCAALLTFLVSWAGNAFSRDACPFADIYANPMGKIGAMVDCEGSIEKVMSVGLPIGLILKTDGYAWYADIFKTEGIPPGAIREGKTVKLSGQYISRKKVMYLGSVIDLPLVFVTGVGE